MHHTRTLAAVALACAAGAFVGGCGGSDGKSDDGKLSAHDLRAQAAAICIAVGNDQNALAKAGKWDEITPRGQQGLADLRALAAPDELKAKFDAFVAAQAKVVTATAPLTDAFAAKDQKQAQRIIEKIAPVDDAADKAAKAAGIPSCGSTAT
jgi:hypothetical protein